MRRSILIFFLLFPLAGFSFTNPKLQKLLESGAYFQFQNEYRLLLLQDSVGSPESDLYYAAWYEHLFGKTESSNKAIANLVNSKTWNCPDSIKTELLVLHLKNDFRSFRYHSADSLSTLLLNEYASVMTQTERDEVLGFSGIVRGLMNTPAQTIERKGDLKIKYKRDAVNLIRIPVSMHEEDGEFVFDTGANLSTICESEAKRMHVRMLNVSFGVASSSVDAVNSKLGIADELKIGNAVFRNVVFIVLPDKALKFAWGLYKIKGIIGIPVIAQLGEIQIQKDGYLFSPAQKSISGLSNLGMSGNTPFVKIGFYQTDHAYIFDTGAAATLFNAPFLQAYEDSLTDPVKKTTKVGGAGGISEMKIIRCKKLPYSFGEKSAILKRGTIQLSASSSVYDTFYGIAGEDIFMEWETMIFNFEDHYVFCK